MKSKNIDFLKKYELEDLTTLRGKVLNSKIWSVIGLFCFGVGLWTNEIPLQIASTLLLLMYYIDLHFLKLQIQTKRYEK